MLSHENRINTKSELKDWIEYERKKYGGGTTGVLREVFPISESDVLRKHILTEQNKNLLDDWLSGVGGFAEEVDKYIIITAKISVYRFEEACQFQYVVSPAILAGYLSLSLQSLGIGACLIQRPLVRTGSWIDLSEKLGIAKDEQIVLMIGVGMLKKEYNVPVSNRLDYKTIVKEL